MTNILSKTKSSASIENIFANISYSDRLVDFTLYFVLCKMNGQKYDNLQPSNLAAI